MQFETPKGCPFYFRVNILPAKDEASGHAFEVSTGEPGKTFQYQLTGRDHHAYLDLFSQLSNDLQLRIPQNRRPSGPRTRFHFPYREVLADNKAPGMLYGYGDPAVTRVREEAGKIIYYLLSTSNDAPDSFPILRSNDLLEWEFTGYVFPSGNKPAWAAEGIGVADYWAPEMHQVGNEFRVYFVARDKETRELCIGLARSLHPEGPFIPEKAPILKNNVIDPHISVQDNSNVYLYWKEDNNEKWPGALNDLFAMDPLLIHQLFDNDEDRRTASFILALWPWAKNLEPMERFLVQQILIEAVIEKYRAFYGCLQTIHERNSGAVKNQAAAVLQYMRTPMYAQRLSQDGSVLTGERIMIIQNDLDWEAHLVEGMWVTKQSDRFYLFYAGNDFSTDQYGIGVAIADHPLGPFTKMQEPFLRSTETWWAPGHPSVTSDPGGQPHLFLHAYFPGNAGYKQFRALLSVPLIFKKDEVLIKDDS
jgi:hypothetical protein